MHTQYTHTQFGHYTLHHRRVLSSVQLFFVLHRWSRRWTFCISVCAMSAGPPYTPDRRSLFRYRLLYVPSNLQRQHIFTEYIYIYILYSVYMSITDTQYINTININIKKCNVSRFMQYFRLQTLSRYLNNLIKLTFKICVINYNILIWLLVSYK